MLYDAVVRMFSRSAPLGDAQGEDQELDVGQILAQHVRILSDVEALEEVASAPRPRHVEDLANRRWAFTRDLLLHCSRMESQILSPMSVDARPNAAQRAKAASVATADFVALFRAHAERWQGFTPPEQWIDYRAATQRLSAAMRALIEREAGEIVPLLPVQPSGAPAPVSKDRYASDSWHIRGLIFGDDQRAYE